VWPWIERRTEKGVRTLRFVLLVGTKPPGGGGWAAAATVAVLATVAAGKDCDWAAAATVVVVSGDC